MPIYPYFCKCGYEEEKWFAMNKDHSNWCPKCGTLMQKHFGKMGFLVDIYNGIDTDLYGTPIEYTSKRHLKELAAKKGCEVVWP